MANALSSKLYQGKPCRNGHDGVRYIKSDECLECKREHNRRWKKSENGRRYNKEWERRTYIPSNRVLMTPDERKASAKASWIKAVNRPRDQGKRRNTC